MRLRAKHGMHLKNQSERSTKVHVDEEGTAHDNMSPQQLETEVSRKKSLRLSFFNQECSVANIARATVIETQSLYGRSSR